MCCYVYNCKNHSENGELSLYKFPHANLCFSKEYQSLQKEESKLGLLSSMVVVPIIRIFMINLNRKLAIKKNRIDRKIVQKSDRFHPILWL